MIGGYDATGPSLVMVSPNGYASRLPYCTMGSGSLAAISIFEAKFKDNLELNDAKNLVIEAVEAGIFHDLGSGSNVDVCVITKDHTDYLRNIKCHNIRAYSKKIPYPFPPNNTPYMRTEKIPIEKTSLQADQKID